ncbi:hypothetical protein QR680_010276 [Steinernema hermaphroditum]|uniref:Uncharacterized protein n=1 Tax=Steinernema hermaphroditum TaxID=289476 RepID=A0AA39INE6_9BILA|nr:hypothetical protein QR680_010276 [Steinernema hermaphroditum]
MAEDVERLEVPTPEQIRRQALKKYKHVCCLCCSLRAKDATFLIAFFVFLMAVYDLSSVRASHFDAYWFWTGVTVMNNSIWVILSVCAVLSVILDHGGLLRPFYILMMVATIFMPFIFVASFVMLLLIEHAGDYKESEVEPWIYRMVSSMFGMPLSIYFTFIVRICFHDFKKLEAASEANKNISRATGLL